MTDPIADMLTRIRNAQLVRKHEVCVPYSKLKANILNLFSREGWVGNVEKIEPLQPAGAKGKKYAPKKDFSERFASLKVEIKYSGRSPKITSLKRISKPGRRVYADKNHIPFVLGGKGLVIVSTSRGLLSDREARKNSLGGEVVCEVY